MFNKRLRWVGRINIRIRPKVILGGVIMDGSVRSGANIRQPRYTHFCVAILASSQNNRLYSIAFEDYYIGGVK